jgi:hypothetical protein
MHFLSLFIVSKRADTPSFLKPFSKYDKVRQLGELLKDDGKTWVRQYDLEYRRKNY